MTFLFTLFTITLRFPSTTNGSKTYRDFAEIVRKPHHVQTVPLHRNRTVPVRRPCGSRTEKVVRSSCDYVYSCIKQNIIITILLCCHKQESEKESAPPPKKKKTKKNNNNKKQKNKKTATTTTKKKPQL